MFSPCFVTMDEGMNNRELDINEDFNKEEVSEKTEHSDCVLAECLSPIFRTQTTDMTFKNKILPDSSEDDIPSYQVNQSGKECTFETEDEDSNDNGHCHLPISPPTSLNKSLGFHRVASVHTIGTIRKSNETNHVNSKLDDNVGSPFSLPLPPPLQCLSQAPTTAMHAFTTTSDKSENKNIFDSLGMMDKDISWVSSMATPPPCQAVTNELNTIERATFLPEEEFRCMQPRALFSPGTDDDFGLKPLDVSSASESEASSYKSKVRLSDVCDVLNNLFVQSIESNQETIFEEQDLKVKPSLPSPKGNFEGKNILVERAMSPVILTRKRKKSDLLKKKRKGALVKSPTMVSCEKSPKKPIEDVATPNITSQSETTVKIIPEETATSLQHMSDLIQDDSFQNMSFSNIDELCKISFTDKNSVSNITLKPLEVNTTNVEKFYYDNTDTELKFRPTPTEDQLKNTKLLEEADAIAGNKVEIDRTFVTKKGFIAFDQCDQDKGLKRMREAESSVKKKKRRISESKRKSDGEEDVLFLENVPAEKEAKETNLEASKWSSIEPNLLETDYDLTDTQMFRTLEDIEKMMEISNNDSKTLIKGDVSNNGHCEQDRTICSNQKESLIKFNVDIKSDTGIVGFRTLSGLKIAVSDKALEKAKNIFENLDEGSSSKFNQAAEERVSNRSNLKTEEKELRQVAMRPSDDFGATKENITNEKGDKIFGFSTASGNKIAVSGKSLSKAKALLELDENVLEPKSAEKLDINPYDKNLDINTTNFSLGFRTAAGKQVEVSKKALAKARNILETEESNERLEEKGEAFKSNILSIETNFGFSTASGKKISVSKEALAAAKILIESDEPKMGNVGKEPFVGFSTASGKKIQMSKESLAKAKTLLEFDDINPLEKKKIINEPTPSTSGTSKYSFSSCSSGFSTASGRKIEVSDKSLIKAKAFLESHELENKDDPTTSCYKINKPCLLGFSTASGKKCQVSDKALAKARTLLDSSECSVEIEVKSLQKSKVDKEDSTKKITTSLGFSTASGKAVVVSQKALDKAKTFLELDHPPALETKDVSEMSIEASDKIGLSTETMTSLKSKEISFSIEDQLRSDSVATEDSTLKRTAIEKSSLLDDSEWDEIIPSWLHVFNTSPSFIDDGNKSDSVATKLFGKFQTSPVLGVHDRFFNRKPGKCRVRGRKLDFESNNKNNVPSGPCFEKKAEKRNFSKLSVDFSVPFKKLKLEKTENISGYDELNLEVLEGRRKARENQENMSKEKVKPVKGSHLLKKCNEVQKKWQDVVSDEVPQVYDSDALSKMGIKESVMEVTIGNAADFKFDAIDFFDRSTCFSNVTGVSVGDGASLILDKENHVGVEEFTRAFMSSPGVEPGLISKQWVHNHFKWIVWKLAHYETSFPKHFGNRGLTPHNVMLQLKYRYDREIDLHERSALKKILERDDTAAKRMVLCVFSIKKLLASDVGSETTTEMSGYELGLTDGWYGCPARTDSAMDRFIETGKVQIGSKLIMHGAELVNCDQGAMPLEIGEAVHLKIATNSTRRARWDTKLGFQKNCGCIPVSLNSILPMGGQVSRVDVIVARIYPVVFKEKTSDGRNVFRSSRAEDRAAAIFQQEQQARVEKIYSEIQEEMQKATSANAKKPNKKLSSLPISQVTSGEDLCFLLESSSDPESFQSLLTIEQRQELLNYQQRYSELKRKELSDKLEAKLKGEKMNKRNVSQLLRMKVIDYRDGSKPPGLVTLWSPPDHLLKFFSEGKAVSLLNVTVGQNRFYQVVQLNTTRKTLYKEIPSHVEYPARKILNFAELSRNFQPCFNEIDLAGIVVQINKQMYGSSLLQTIYLADCDQNFIGIALWRGEKDYGWEDVITIKSVIAGSNLIWKKNSGLQSICCVYVNETTLFTRNPKSPHLEKGIEDLKNSVPQDLNGFISECQEKLNVKLDDQKNHFNRNASTSSNADDSTRDQSKQTNGFGGRPNASSTPLKPSRHKDIMMESTNDPSPIQKKIEVLKNYGEPPALSPVVFHSSQRLRSKFKVPERSHSPATD